MDQATHKYKKTFLLQISYLNILFFFVADEKIWAFKFGLITVSKLKVISRWKFSENFLIAAEFGNAIRFYLGL